MLGACTYWLHYALSILSIKIIILFIVLSIAPSEMKSLSPKSGEARVEVAFSFSLILMEFPFQPYLDNSICLEFTLSFLPRPYQYVCTIYFNSCSPVFKSQIIPI